MAHREFNYQNRHVYIEEELEDTPAKVTLRISGREIEIVQDLDTGDFRAPNELFAKFRTVDELAKRIIDLNQPE